MQLTSLVLIAIAVLVGSLLPFQAGVNATIARYFANPVMAALTNTAIASVVLFSVLLLWRPALPTLSKLASAPWYAWCGGVIGAALVFSGLYVAPRLGAAAYVSATLVGTVAASLLVDHFGLLEFRSQPITGMRLLGALLVIGGMLIIQGQRG